MEIRGYWVVTPSTIGYSPELDPFPYDPDKARQLLAEAGYKTPTNPSGKDFGKLIINTYEDPEIPHLLGRPDAAAISATGRRVLEAGAGARRGGEGDG